MSERNCRYEEDVVRSVGSGGWDPVLLRHVDACTVCRDTRSVASWVLSRQTEDVPPVREADARRLWRIASAGGHDAECIPMHDAALVVLAVGRRLAWVLVAASAVTAVTALDGALTNGVSGIASWLQAVLVPLASAGSEWAGVGAALLLGATARSVHRALAH